MTDAVPPPADCVVFSDVCVAAAYAPVTDYVGLFSRMDANNQRYVVPADAVKALGARIVLANSDYNPSWETDGLTALPPDEKGTFYYYKTCASPVSCAYQWSWVDKSDHPMVILKAFSIEAASPEALAKAEANIWLKPMGGPARQASVMTTVSTTPFNPKPWVFRKAQPASGKQS